MTEEQRGRFDGLVAEVIEDLPDPIRDMLEDIAVVVLDVPTPELLKGIEDPEVASDPESLCGLHSGRAITEGIVERSAELPNQIHLFRVGIVSLAGGWEGDDADDRVYEEIRVTLLHELGHEMGLDEDDLYDLGYE